MSKIHKVKKSKTEQKAHKSDRSWAGKVILTGEEVSKSKGSQHGVKNFSYCLTADGGHDVYHDGVKVAHRGPYGQAGSAHTEETDHEITAATA